jgi:hypothetical protein
MVEPPRAGVSRRPRPPGCGGHVQGAALRFLDNLFNRIPAWAAQLPLYLRPSRPAIQQLERVRRRLRLRHDFFSSYIACHAETTRKVLMRAYYELRQASMTETDARALLLATRINPHAGADSFFGLLACAEGQRERGIREMAERKSTLEAFIDSIVEEEAREAARAGTAIPSPPGFGPGALEIARILKDDVPSPDYS